MQVIVEELPKRVGETIRKLRTDQKLSQEELGFRSSLDRTYISGIERGARNPSLKNLGKIAKALGVPPRDLLDF